VGCKDCAFDDLWNFIQQKTAQDVTFSGGVSHGVAAGASRPRRFVQGSAIFCS